MRFERVGAAGIGSILIGLVCALGAPAAPQKALETIVVSNTNPKPVKSEMVLQDDHRYRISASDTVSDWCTATSCPKGDPNKTAQPNVGVDALYCYAQWRCPGTPQLWRQLQVDGKGLDELAGEAGKIPYNSRHRYSVTVQDLDGRLSLVASDAVTSSSDNSGEFDVQIEDLGLAAEPGTVTLLAQAKHDTDENGEVSFHLFGHFTTAKRLSNCKRESCSLPLTGVRSSAGLQMFEEWGRGSGTVKNLGIHFQVVSGRLDRGLRGQLAVDLAGKVSAITATSEFRQTGDCVAGARVGVYLSEASINFNCGGRFIHVFHRKLTFKLTGSAITG